MKRIIALIASLAIVVLIAPSAARADEPYNFANIPMAEDETVMVIGEPAENEVSNSKLVVQPPSTGSTDTRGSWLQCASSKDKTCDPTNSKLDILGWSILPHCSDSQGEFCVEELELASKGMPFQKADFLRTAAGGVRIDADRSLDLIQGATPSLFRAPDALNSGGTSTFAVVVRIAQHFNHKKGKYEPGDLMANVIPYSEALGNYKAGYMDVSAGPEFLYQITNQPKCVFVEDGVCGLRQNFIEGTKAKLSFKIPKSLGGWFSGRLKDPQISVSQFSSKANLVTIAAESVSVPQLAFVKKTAAIDIEKTFNIGRGGTPNGRVWGLSSGGPGSEDVFRFMELYRKDLNDTASGVSTFWNIGSIAGGQGSNCLNDTSKVLGIATTNAMGYDSKAPSFNRGFLNYKVGGLHYLPGGKEEAQGTYDLVMRSETARCLYGFSKAPVSATVSVLGGNSSSIATTVVSEKDGWLKMAAYGFTFSQKTLQIKMSQKPSAGKTTLTCLKGKVVKRVTAVGPKCPAGYKTLA